MELARNIPLLLILLSLFSGVLSMVFKRGAAKVYIVTLEMVFLALLGVLLAYCLRTGESFTFVLGEFPAPWGNELRAGTLEALLAFVFLLVEVCSVLAGGKFLKVDVDESKINLYFSLVHLLRAALLSLVFTNDLFTGYVFLEILTLTSCGILIIREIGRTTLAAVRYMVLNLLGSGLFLIGVVLFYAITGHLLMVPMHGVIVEIVKNHGELISLSLATGILTIGLGIKSGLFPFHFWMPDTYGWATPTSGSLLSGLVSKGYLFLLIKIYLRVLGTDVLRQMHIGRILFVLGICGMIFGSVSAMRKKNINRMVAFSSAAQIGYIFMGIGIGGLAGYTAAIFHILTHAVTKSLLFLTTPYLAEVSGGSLLFKKLQGSGHRARVAGWFFLIGSLSMIGIPAFAGFSSKLLFGLAVAGGENLPKVLLTMLALGLSSVLNALYFLRTIIRIYSVGDGGAGTDAALEYEEAHHIHIRQMNPAPDGAVIPGETAIPGSPVILSEAKDPVRPSSPVILGEAKDPVRPGGPVILGEAKDLIRQPENQSEVPQGAQKASPWNTRREALAYVIPALVLTAANVILGLFSGPIVELIENGLRMFR